MTMENDKIIQFQVDNGVIYALTESGQLYQKSLAAGSDWQKIPAPAWFKKKEK